MNHLSEDNIHDAVRSSIIQRVRGILQRNPSCVNDLDVNFSSPLHLIYDDHADEEDHREDNRLLIMKLLIEYGADVNIRDRQDKTPLHLTVARHKINGVKVLLENRANPDIRQYINHTALMTAVYAGYDDHKDDTMLKLLLDYNANPNLTDGFGNTALDSAFYCVRLDYVQILLSYGAKVINVYRTISRISHLFNSIKSLAMLYSILINCLRNHTNQIVEHGHFFISSIGLCCEAYSCIRDERMIAFLQSLRMLGVNIYQSNFGNSDLHVAVHEGKAKAVRALLKKKETNVNAKNSNLDTLLHFIIKIKNMVSFGEIGCMLLEAGADWRVPNLIDETPFYLAVVHKQLTLVDLMLRKVARVDNTTSRFDSINLPALRICYTENDVALHELLVAICLGCESVIDRLLDEEYIMVEASQDCRQDLSIALAKAVELNDCNIVKKLLKAGFRTNRQFPGDLSDLTRTTGDKIRLSCLLWEFNDRTCLFQLIFGSLCNYSDSNPNLQIYLLLYYFILDDHAKDSNLMWLQSSYKWQNILKTTFAKYKEDLFEMKNKKLADVSLFNIMSMELNSFVKFLNNQEFYNVCMEKFLELQKFDKLQYFDDALQNRLELALEKNRAMNLALHSFNDISKNCLTKTNLTYFPYNIVLDILLNFNMRDLEKFTLSCL